MGSGNTKPPEFDRSARGLQDLPETDKVMPMVMEQLKNGFSQGTIDQFNKTQRAFGENAQGQIGNNLAQGTQSLNESMAQAGGNIPIDALLKGKVALQSGANAGIADITDKLGERDFQFAMEKEKGKAGAFGNYANLLQMALASSAQKNQMNINRWQMENEDSGFDWGSLIGGVVKGGAQIASVLI